ncbi:hotdog fold thioesterase [Stutzerimonas stutzeri]|uniref:Hotdog fold thioesterase n=1 Tax=Stutzerimonas stutzeri TaxID=316 RepID=A0A6I6LHH7_STUST|nr:hotdog fold thioesterase [Stutzerimonas stutzeri]
MKGPDVDPLERDTPTHELPISGGKDLPGFHQVLGYRQVSWSQDEAVIELDVQACHLNMAGVLHGGVLTALLDVVLAEAGTYCPYPGRVRKAITLVLNTTFTGQCSGGVIRAIGKRRAGGTRIFNSSGEVRDQDDRLLAIGEATFRLRSGSEHPQGVPLTFPAQHNNKKENGDV